MESTSGAQEPLDIRELQQVHYSWSSVDTCGVSGRLQVSEYGILWHRHPSSAHQSGTPEEGLGEADENGGGSEASLYDEALASEVIDLKTAFEDIPKYDFTEARKLANGFEILDEPAFNPFLNRSALKLANLDCLLKGEFVSKSGAGDPQGRLTFVDLCGGPGGFSEYLLRRCEVMDKPATGWGMTLQGGECPWNLRRIGRWAGGGRKRKRPEARDEGVGEEGASAGDSETGPGENIPEAVLHLCNGVDGTGDLTVWANVLDLATKVQADTKGVGVDLVVADGGFTEARSRLDQEHVMVPLVLSEVLAMSLLLRRGGLFVCKLFDVTLPATLLALHTLALGFDSIALVKPITSRPASSERYIVCEGRREACGPSLSAHWQPLKAALEGALRGSLASEHLTIGDGPFRRFVRLCNDRALQSQRDACYAILDAVEVVQQQRARRRKRRRREAQREREGEGEGGEPGEEGQGSEAEGGGSEADGRGKEDMDTMRREYRCCWRLEGLRREDGGTRD